MKTSRRAVKVHLAILLALAVSLALAPTRETRAFHQAHARVKAVQPEGLSMELKLPKARFYRGEVIPATLLFKNTSANPYFAWRGADGRFHNGDVAFHAIDRKGRAVADPFKLYNERCGHSGGSFPGSHMELGELEITLTANEWLRFDQPGVYRLYASSQKATPGSSDDVFREGGPPIVPVALVSKIVTIRIDPLPLAQEQYILEQIRRDLPGREGYAALARLEHLQTPAARDLLRSRLEDPKAYNTNSALLMVPDPGAEAASILEAVRAGKRPIGYNTLRLYADLKRMAAPGPILHTNPDPMLTELLDAARATLHGELRSEVASKNLVALFQNDRNDPATRALVVEHQLELNETVAGLLLSSLRFLEPPDWKTNEKARAAQVQIDRQTRDFLPLVRRSASPPRSNLVALTILARLEPEEARRRIVDDIQHPPFQLRTNDSNVGYALAALCSLPKGTLLPELDATFHARLHPALGQHLARDEEFDVTMRLVERYGTPALLPGVLRAYRGSWCGPHHADALRYILRCDGEIGRALLRKALAVRPPNGSQTLLTDVLRYSWQPEALPVVLEALDSPDEEIWSSAVEVIAAHAAGGELAEKMIATAERLNTKSLPAGPYGERITASRQNRLVEALAQNDAWQLTRDQLLRLKVLPSNREYTRTMLDNRLAKAGQ